MKTKINKIEAAIKANRGLVKSSFIEILNTGKSYTGKSGYSKGWATKSVWTSDVTGILNFLKIKYEAGNNAPRGGANGEYVKIIDKVLLKQIAERNAQLKEAAEIAKKEAELARNEAYKKAEAYVATLPSNEAFENKWNNLEMKTASGLSWSEYRNSLIQQYPNEWLILKAKFKAKQSIS